MRNSPAGFGSCVFFACYANGQAPAPAAAPHENLNAVLWVQSAAEYRASALQTYRAAEASMIRALQDKSWTAAIEQRRPVPDLPPAVILDLDETVLDNSSLSGPARDNGRGLYR